MPSSNYNCCLVFQFNFKYLTSTAVLCFCLTYLWHWDVEILFDKCYDDLGSVSPTILVVCSVLIPVDRYWVFSNFAWNSKIERVKGVMKVYSKFEIKKKPQTYSWLDFMGRNVQEVEKPHKTQTPKQQQNNTHTHTKPQKTPKKK